jgi:putative membrane protein
VGRSIRSAEPVGKEPDARFSYANERTFLAWIRTALRLMTAGLAITQLLREFDLPGGRRLIGLPLIALGVVIAVASYRQWRANERAMRLDRPLLAIELAPHQIRFNAVAPAVVATPAL